MIHKLVVIWMFVLFAPMAMAQVSFEAKPSKKQLGLNERLRVDFVMNKDGDNFTPPGFQGFQVVGGPNQAVSTSWTNGQVSYSKTYTYFLSPQKKGRLTINQASIEIDGKVYKTTPISVVVTNAVERPKDPNSPEAIADNTIHLVAEISNETPYLNEAISVVYKLYISPKVSVSNTREIDFPKYEDFWSQTINIKKFQAQRGEFKGEPYQYVVWKKAVLYPQKTGKLTLEPLTIDLAVDVPTNRRDIFGSRMYRTVTKRVTAGARNVRVKPLPTKGRPENFSGAVGTFSFDVNTTRKQLKAGESLQAKLKVSGNGNLKLFNLPPLTIPRGIEKYEPEHSERINTTLRGMQGSIEDSYTLVPQSGGQFPIPPVAFSYFDTKSKTYKTITSEEIVLDVQKGPEGQQIVSGTLGDTNNKQVVNSAQRQFKFIKQETDLKEKNQERFFNSVAYWSALTLPLLAIPLFLFIGAKRRERVKDVKGNKIRKANRLARKYLSEAKKNLNNPTVFYEAMERALHNYLKAKLSIQTSEMSKDRIRQVLQSRNVNESSIDEFLGLLQNCEFARYTPTTVTAADQDYQKATQVITELDRQL